MHSDRSLIEGCLAGDRQVWERLVRRYERLIYSIGLSSGLCEEDAADVFLTVCTALIENLEKLRDDQHLTGWLILTARREAWRQRRLALRHISLQQAEEDALFESLSSDEPLPHDDLVRLEDAQMVRLALQELSDTCRRLLELRYLADPPLSYAQIAKRMDVSAGAIGPMRARCLQKMRKLLEDKGF